MQSIEVEADSVELATATALQQLGVAADSADVEVLTEPSRGLFGLGGKKARVRVTRRPAPLSATPELLESTEDEEAAAPALRSRVEMRLESDEEPEHRGDDEDLPSAAGPLDDATVARAAEVLDNIVKLTGIEAEVVASNDSDHVTLDLVGDSSGLLIGRRGQMLDALEYVVGRILGKEYGHTVHVTVDSQGYRGRRQTALEEMALRMSEEARRRRRPIRLPELTPRERRIVHMALRRERGITTKSSGEGQLRTLVIIPNESSGRRRAG